ncbi:MAG: hypothetical protein ACTHM9_03070 [Gemmatimonadales bacterium]|jgi:hypothetical protein
MTPTRLLLLLALSACAPHIDLTADRAELLRLHDQARTAHLEKRADLLVASFADSLMEISRGLVSLRGRAESERRFRSYFDRVSFQQWDDVAPPRIRISPDGQMAYVVVQKSVRLTSTEGMGTPKAEHTIFAWVEIYEKHHGQWTLMAVASTDQPGAA